MMDTVFIIEDDKDIFDALNTLLVVEGMKCIAYDNYHDAADHIVDDSPCAVFFDLNVPDWMTPEAFVAKIRQEHPSLTLVVISGNPASQKIAERLGASGALVKPFAPEEVVKWARKTCPSRRVSRRHP